MIRRLWSWLFRDPYVITICRQGRLECSCGWTSRFVVWTANARMVCPRCGLRLLE